MAQLTEVTETTLTVSAGSSDSSADYLDGHAIKRILVPDAATQGTSLVVLHASSVAGPFLPSYDTEGSLIALPFKPGASVELVRALYDATLWVKVRLMQADGVTPQVQSAARSLVLVAIPRAVQFCFGKP